MRMFITSKNKYLWNDMKILGTSSIPLISNSTQTKILIRDHSESFTGVEAVRGDTHILLNFQGRCPDLAKYKKNIKRTKIVQLRT